MSFHCKTIWRVLYALGLLMGICLAADDTDFRDVQVEEPYKTLLLSKKDTMSLSGVKEFCDDASGARYIVCIVSTPSKGTTPKAKMTMMKICRTKAMTELQRAVEVEISGFRRFEEKITSVSDGKKEKITSISNFLEIAEERVHGIVRTMPVIGTWYSLDGTEFYLAIGKALPPHEAENSDSHE